MKSSRAVWFPLLLVFFLLFAQQAGAVHTLHHVLEDWTQHDKQLPHSDTCEQCAAYAQLGNALSVSTYNFTPLVASVEVIQRCVVAFRSVPVLAAVARGPPIPLQKFA